jgi:hypothetical protein
MFNTVNVDLTEGYMTIFKGDCQGISSGKLTRTESGDGARMRESRRDFTKSQPATEISDKDYRSFWLPCDALEETDKRKKGG